MSLFMYGPPGAGKTTVGRLLANSLELPFVDLDGQIEARQGKAITAIFAEQGEPGFRRLETEELRRVVESGTGVVALGGGALLNPANRELVEKAGTVVCLQAAGEILAQRVAAETHRPLLNGERRARLENLLEERAGHYKSFAMQINTGGLEPEQVAWRIQIELGRFRLVGMGAGYDVLVQAGGLNDLGARLRQTGLGGPVMLVSDEHVGRLHTPAVQAAVEAVGYACKTVLLPAGEAHKTIETVNNLWQAFLAAGLERGSTVVALGGGVVTDLAGFAAATYLRSIPCVSVPTSLLGMVDAGLGGKTGADLPQGKNLVGAFYPPRLVLCDPLALNTLPEVELRNGLAEVVKHGIIGDPDLLAVCGQGRLVFESGFDWETLTRRAVAVKVAVLLEDPYERGRREVLNFGHTVGHAIEKASGYGLRHGEAVAVGMVVETRIAEAKGIAATGLSNEIEKVLRGLGLPAQMPGGIDLQQVRLALGVDKKRQGGRARLALPRAIGWVEPGFEFSEEELWRVCLSCMGQT